MPAKGCIHDSIHRHAGMLCGTAPHQRALALQQAPHLCWNTSPAPKRRKEEAEEEYGPPSLVSKASGGITENTSFGIGKYLDFFPPLIKMHSSCLLNCCVISGTDVAGFLFFILIIGWHFQCALE